MAEADTGTWEGRVSGAWANDPWGRHRFRWHDGTAWSAHVSDGTSQGLDPVVLASPAAAPQPSSDELIERLVQSARAAIDAQLAARPPVAPPQPVARTTPAPAVAGVAASKDTRRPVPWAWIAAGIAVPVAVWCLYNARDRDESSSVADVTAESTTTTTTTTAPAPTTTVATPDTIEVDSVPPGAVTAVPVEPVDPALVERCVEFAQFAAYIGDSEMSVFWTNAGLNVDTLRANCAALPPSELERLAQRKADMDLFMTGAPAP
jgi:hypothetical protein